MKTSLFSEHWKLFGELAMCLDSRGVVRATKYLSPRLVIKATRRTVRGRIDNRDSIAQIHFTIGVPNYDERLFIKQAKKAGEPFPIKNVQIKYMKGRG